MSASPLVRAKSALRRHKPRALVPYLIKARYQKRLADPAFMARAREHMEFVLGVASPDQDLDDAARRYAYRMVERSENRWHSALVNDQRVEGLEHLTERDRSRGVVVSFLHHGAYGGSMSSLGRLCPDVHVVVAEESLQPDAPEWLKQHVRVGGMFCTVVSTEEGSKGFAARLERGQILAIATDVPGSTEVTFLGRKLKGSSGAARLAAMTNSQIVVMTSHQEPDGRPYLKLSEPIEPGAFADPNDILAALLARHESAVLAWPEMYDMPKTRWGLLADESAQAGSS